MNGKTSLETPERGSKSENKTNIFKLLAVWGKMRKNYKIIWWKTSKSGEKVEEKKIYILMQRNYKPYKNKGKK